MKTVTLVAALSVLLAHVTLAQAQKAPLPGSLSQQAFNDGIAEMRTRVQACSSVSPAKGTVTVSVKVAPNGKVSSASATGSPEPKLGACVKEVLERGIFEKTQAGGTYNHSFKF